jgi:hypothetical protein
VGAERSGVDEHEFARRRITAVAYGFSSWAEFREWRRRNPVACRERSRQLLEPSDPTRKPALVVELFAGARRERVESADRNEPASS